MNHMVDSEETHKLPNKAPHQPFQQKMEIYVDDFIYLVVVVSQHQIQNATTNTFHAINNVFASIENGKKVSISLKKIKKGNVKFTTNKVNWVLILMASTKQFGKWTKKRRQSVSLSFYGFDNPNNSTTKYENPATGINPFKSLPHIHRNSATMQQNVGKKSTAHISTSEQTYFGHN